MNSEQKSVDSGENSEATQDETTGGIRKVPPAPDAIVPQNMEQVRLLLTGRDERFREPLTNREEREYQKVWKQGGKGFTKPLYSSSETTRRKKRQRNKSKWAKERGQEITREAKVRKRLQAVQQRESEKQSRTGTDDE
jgi:hypothetical protein